MTIYQENKSLKLEGLNAVRFIAFFWVFCKHTLPTHTDSKNYFTQLLVSFNWHGHLGVDLFFVLSSFLLTYLGLAEKASTRNFSVRNFLIRRVLRIFPLYYLILAITFLVLPVVSNLTRNNIDIPKNCWLYLFFLSNYDSGDHIFAIKFLWTVAIEAQYYWIFAFALLLLRRNFITVTALFLCMYVFVFFMLYPLHMQIPDAPLFYLGDFSIGGLFAILFFYFNDYAKSLKILVPLLVISCFVWWLFRNTNEYFDHLLLVIFLAVTLLMFISVGERKSIKSNIVYRALDYLGLYTYGLYVYSGFVIAFIALVFNHFNMRLNLLLLFSVELLLLFAVAFTSYQLYEVKFLAYCKKFKWKYPDWKQP